MCQVHQTEPYIILKCGWSHESFVPLQVRTHWWIEKPVLQWLTDISWVKSTFLIFLQRLQLKNRLHHSERRDWTLPLQSLVKTRLSLTLRWGHSVHFYNSRACFFSFSDLRVVVNWLPLVDVRGTAAWLHFSTSWSCWNLRFIAWCLSSAPQALKLKCVCVFLSNTLLRLHGDRSLVFMTDDAQQSLHCHKEPELHGLEDLVLNRDVMIKTKGAQNLKCTVRGEKKIKLVVQVASVTGAAVGTTNVLQTKSVSFMGWRSQLGGATAPPCLQSKQALHVFSCKLQQNMCRWSELQSVSQLIGGRRRVKASVGWGNFLNRMQLRNVFMMILLTLVTSMNRSRNEIKT